MFISNLPVALIYLKIFYILMYRENKKKTWMTTSMKTKLKKKRTAKQTNINKHTEIFLLLDFYIILK